MIKPSKHGSVVSIRMQDGDGRHYITRVPRDVAEDVKKAAEGGSLIKIVMDEHGRVTGIHAGNEDASLPHRLRRFAVPIEPPTYAVYMPDEWKDLVAELSDPDNKRKRILFHGSEGAGKTTLIRLIIMECRKQWGPDRTVVLSLQAEPDDRFVGALQSKSLDFAVTTGMLSKAGYRVIWLIPELESTFAVGDYRPGWDLQHQASLRDLLDGIGPAACRPDLVLADCNYLDRIEPPTQSRFARIPITLSRGFAQGLLKAHWPAELPLNGQSSGQLIQTLLDRCYQEPVATATMASRNKRVLRVSDLTAWNGRFLADFAADLERRARSCSRKQPGFVVDEGFVLSVLSDHLAAAVRPVAEAAGTHAVRRFVVGHPNHSDLIVAVEPTLGWCNETQFLA